MKERLVDLYDTQKKLIRPLQKLQDGISELWRKRAVMKYYLEKMDLLVTSVETIGETIPIRSNNTCPILIEHEQ